ncbi:helix-turn-helix domain-containing protein, partial [Stenotrophomonas sp. SrG]|uniref:helix-turn-helix domain-containing protein n=1 Tax=Stenotrophomonas sp. SrG TaxID=3414430 RepID=UPI003CEB4B5B
MTSLAEWNTTPTRAGGAASVLDRIISILDAVRESGGFISITELAERTTMPKSTVSRLVADLTAQRYLERADEGVTLGLRLFELGARASMPRRLLAAAAPVIRN